MEIIKGKDHRDDIIALLSSEKLPTDDLPASLDNFLLTMADDELVGVAGVEIYGRYGLLRSLAVRPDFRNQNIAGKLIAQIENFVAAEGLKAIFLLTENASDYFLRKGYIVITRSEMPVEVQQSSEFSHVCPQSAIAMKKNL